MKYRVTAIWDEELYDSDPARVREALELDLRESTEMEFENLRVDVQQLPRTHIEEEGGQIQMFPPGGVVHPWDEGKWIFPNDHPLAGFERAAKTNRDESQKQAFLEAGQKMLPRGDE